MESTDAPAVAGWPRRILRAEGGVLLAAALTAYVVGLEQPLWLVPVLLLLPDLAMAGYARSSRLGAWTYNAAHSCLAPAALGGMALSAEAPLGQGLALIWFAHIGLDRLAGYGLKYETAFEDTHLGRIGQGRGRQVD